MSFSLLARLALADVRERTRRTGYLISLAVMVYLGQGMLPPNGSGYRTYVISEAWRPAYGAAWVGTLSALLTGVYLLMIGHYLVKGSIERDRQTGVGQVLAAARVGKLTYLWSKAISHFAVLMSMAAVSALVALVTQQLLGEDRHMNVLATLFPYFVLTVPMAMYSAAGAVLFECIPVLRGGLGNIAWFFLFGMVLMAGGVDQPSRNPYRDLAGGHLVSTELLSHLHAIDPSTAAQKGDMSFGVNVNPRFKDAILKTFPWDGLRVTPVLLLSRLFWLAISAMLVLIASLFFDRFDAAARRFGRSRLSLGGLFARFTPPRAARARMMSAAALSPARRGFAFAGVLRAELLLALHGQPWWWWAGTIALVCGQLFAPLSHVCKAWLPIASFWPVLVWSAAGQRETRDGVAGVLFSCPRPVSRLLSAAWLAGVILALAIGAPSLLRLALDGQGAAAGGWLLGAAFVPALALALGVWSGSSRFFEVLYLFLWYIGPMHAVAEFDYTGVTAPRDAAVWAGYAIATAVLLVLAWEGRRRQVKA